MIFVNGDLGLHFHGQLNVFLIAGHIAIIVVEMGLKLAIG